MAHSVIVPSKAGLRDPRVKTYTDRGNHFYEQYRKRLGPSSPLNGKISGECWSELVSRIKKELWNSTETPAGGPEATVFLPRNKLWEILTPARVLMIVSGLPGSTELSKNEQVVFTEEINRGTEKNGRSLKLLAALLASDLENQFYSLVKQGTSDTCLPPSFNKNGTDYWMDCYKCFNRHSFLHIDSKKNAREFYNWAYGLNAPYFKKPDQTAEHTGSHAHYVLTHEDVLPIVNSSNTDHKTKRSSSSYVNKSEGAQEGGFSTVTRVEFHSDHYDLGSHKNKKYTVFAMKKLKAPDEESFSKEIASLLAFQAGGNHHLVQLLATFEIRNENANTQYFLLFPWADGTLWDFWRLHDAESCRTTLPQWMAEQCYRLASALQVFHNERSTQLTRLPSEKGNDRELFGRHGDIKAENILWFQKPNELVLNDFGLAGLHTKVSRSAQDPKTMARTETYRAPEFDIPRGKISRSSDIFSMGCTFLEFVTWYMEGHHSASEEFTNQRLQFDPEHGFKTDTFFEIEDQNGKIVPIIKTKVKAWIDKLRRRPDCTNYINDFLDLIELRMLEPDPKMRWGSGRVVERLRVLSETCRTDTSYWKEPKGSEPRSRVV